jgi:hypothetical protein
MSELVQRFNETFMSRFVPTARNLCGYRNIELVVAKADEFNENVRKGREVVDEKVAGLRLSESREDEEDENEWWLGEHAANDNEGEEETASNAEVDGDVDMNDVE